jgi:hypothetical protein
VSARPSQTTGWRAPCAHILAPVVRGGEQGGPERGDQQVTQLFTGQVNALRPIPRGEGILEHPAEAVTPITR